MKGTRNHLARESQAAYRGIGLHFHDLRREAASRFYESGATLAEVRDLLGHPNIAQTSTYLGSSGKGLQSAIERRDAHEQQLAEAYHAATQQAAQSEGFPAGTTAPDPVTYLGSDRIQ